jgi:putative tryptophan/tyrosine transport system substrate-binding protein
MHRRQFLATLGAGIIAKAGPAVAQAPARSYRLGTATPLTAITETSRFGQILARTLAEHGYVVGKNLTWDARSTDGNNARLPAIFGDFKNSRVDAVIIVGFQTALAAKSSGILAVGAIGLGDPVETKAHASRRQSHRDL